MALPVAPAWSTRRIIDHVYGLAGHRPRSLAAGRSTLRLVGLLKPAMREYQHTLYQFTDRWVVDDSKFRAAFGGPGAPRATPIDTPIETALAVTLAWYRDDAAHTPPRPLSDARRTPQ